MAQTWLGVSASEETICHIMMKLSPRYLETRRTPSGTLNLEAYRRNLNLSKAVNNNIEEKAKNQRTCLFR